MHIGRGPWKSWLQNLIFYQAKFSKCSYIKHMLHRCLREWRLRTGMNKVTSVSLQPSLWWPAWSSTALQCGSLSPAPPLTHHPPLLYGQRTERWSLSMEMCTKLHRQSPIEFLPLMRMCLWLMMTMPMSLVPTPVQWGIQSEHHIPKTWLWKVVSCCEKVTVEYVGEMCKHIIMSHTC